ncbi:MAG TPA: amidohydrolase family protein, partial [Propionibacteriaceae bacterium]|nr:amidohydrolase family protein [Propionibacteriaceae bacterium]
SAALALYGLNHPTGHLIEHDAFGMQTRMNETPDATLDAWVANAARDAASRGIVGIVDYEMAWNPGVWGRRVASGFDTLRVKVATYPLELDRAIGEGMHSGKQLDEFGLLTMGPLKIIADGSLTARTAWCHSPYPTPSAAGPQGVPNYSWDELIDLIGRADRDGLDCAVHAIGDRAAAMVLDAFTETGARGSIEHAQLLTADDRGRMASLGLTAGVQPAHLLDDRDAAETLWPGRTAGAFAYASLRDVGVPLVFGSDAPVSPLNPWLAIQAAVTRTVDGRPAWHPEQCLSMDEAVGASTGGVRSLVSGASADLIALDVNPFEVDPASLSGIRTSLTMVAGRTTHTTLPN